MSKNVSVQDEYIGKVKTGFKTHKIGWWLNVYLQWVLILV